MTVLNWETTETVPNQNRSRIRMNVPVLQPGQIMRRVAKSASSAHYYRKIFAKNGAAGYNAVSRTIDGQIYVYIWRDSATEEKPTTRIVVRNS